MSCETDVSEGFGQSVAVRRGEVDTIEYNRDKGVGVTVYPRPAARLCEHLRLLEEGAQVDRGCGAVDRALHRTRPVRRTRGRGTDGEGEGHAPSSTLFHPWNIDVAEAIELARRCENAAFAVSPKISNSEGANTSIQQSHFVSANSHGFLGGYATTRHGLSCSVIAGEGDGMQREYWYDSRRDPAELMAAEDVGRLAGERALARLGAKKIRTCEVPVLFEAQLAVALIGNFVQAVSGGSLYRKSNFLLDSLGHQVSRRW